MGNCCSVSENSAVNRFEEELITGSNTPSTLIQSEEVKCSSLIGTGPFGNVYKAAYRGSAVAVKKCDAQVPQRLATRQNVLLALDKEGSSLSCLRHPNIVLFMGAYLQQQMYCVVSEYCARFSLYDVLHGKEMHAKLEESNINEVLPWSLRARLALGAARGLLYLHTADPPLVHNQLKSSNVLIDDSWNAKLADFGARRVAKAVHTGLAGGKVQTQPEKITHPLLLRWTAPELVKLSGKITYKLNRASKKSSPEAADVFSLGMILWELVVCEVPYSELKDCVSIAKYILSGKRPFIPSEMCSVAWTELIHKCWSHEASDRPNAKYIVDVLESIVDSIKLEPSTSNMPNRLGKGSSLTSRYGSESSMSSNNSHRVCKSLRQAV